jgi:hypothetical protein
MKIDEALRGISRLAFDTSPIIYFVEANPTYDALVSNIFARIASGEIEGRTSVISLSEVLVKPILAHRNDLQSAYRELLLKSSNFQTLFYRRDDCGTGGSFAGSLRPSLA